MASHILNPEFSNWWREMQLNDVSRFGDCHANKHPEWIDLTVAEMRKKFELIVIAIKRDKNFISTPLSDEKIIKDDILVLIGNNY